MRVIKGEEIMEIKTGNTLIVEHDFDSEKDVKPSSVFDFMARYIQPAGVTFNGEKVYGNRAFTLSDEGIVWERL